jgi:hypothetical protein
MKFCRTFDVTRYQQIVMIKKQSEEGAPEIRFFFQPEGYGVCHFGIGWDDDEEADKKADEAFKNMVPREVIEIVDGYMKHMQAKSQNAH